MRFSSGAAWVEGNSKNGIRLKLIANATALILELRA
jgi:hypothetical protein